jgi:hypothetical protein
LTTFDYSHIIHISVRVNVWMLEFLMRVEIYGRVSY